MRGQYVLAVLVYLGIFAAVPAEAQAPTAVSQLGAASNVADKRSDDWLERKLLDENAIAYRTVWDLYLRFYTVFLTFSITALALTVQYVAKKDRGVIVIAFVLQNVLCAATAIQIADFSAISAHRYRQLAALSLSTNAHGAALGVLDLASSPVPASLGVWGGAANAISHVLLICCWLSVPRR